jgi:hypothetical protein
MMIVYTDSGYSVEICDKPCGFLLLVALLLLFSLSLAALAAFSFLLPFAR